MGCCYSNFFKLLQFKRQTMMPFCFVPSKNPPGVHSCYLLLLFVLPACLDGKVVSDAVKLGEAAIIPCNKICNGHVLWQFKTKSDWLEVLQCVQGTCTEGPSFKNRVNLSEKNKTGNLSLTLHRVVYNDEGWYQVLCDSTFLCQFHLEVFVPSTVNTTFGGNVTLPCYARTEKQIPDDAVNIIWKKDDQTVLHIQEGIPKYGSGFTGRASVSLQHYKEGDFSITILWVTMADNGLYRCYHNPEEEHGHPGAVTLNVIAHQNVYAKKIGDNLTLDLFGSDPVTVTFTGSAEAVVCNVTACSPEYINRVSVMNSSFVMSGLTTSDTGTFTVKDKTGEVISINTVTVEGVTQRFRFIPLILLSAFVLSCICLYLCHRRNTQAPETRSHYDAGESTVLIEPARQPAIIGFSQEETNPNISEESDDYVHTPVEETMPMIVTIEKQDNTEEEEYIKPL